MNMQPILLAICTDLGREMLCISRKFHNFCDCRDKPDDDEWLNSSIVPLYQSQSSKLCVSLQYAMLCTTPSSSSSSCVSTNDVSCVSTDDVSDVSTDDVSDVSTDDVSCVSTTDDVSSSCISVEN